MTSVFEKLISKFLNNKFNFIFPAMIIVVFSIAFKGKYLETNNISDIVSFSDVLWFITTIFSFYFFVNLVILGFWAIFPILDRGLYLFVLRCVIIIFISAFLYSFLQYQSSQTINTSSIFSYIEGNRFYIITFYILVHSYKTILLYRDTNNDDFNILI
ncbi:MAG: hypothetical protein ACI8TE_000394 [Francisella sp.]|jgi:hypothetical protein